MPNKMRFKIIEKPLMKITFNWTQSKIKTINSLK